MKNIILLIKKDIIRFTKDKPAMLLTFIVPAVLIVIFGNIFGGGGGSARKANVILVNDCGNEISRMFEKKLNDSESLNILKEYTEEDGKKVIFTEDKAKEFIKSGKVRAALIMPQDFYADTSSGLKFKLYYDPRNEIESAIIQGSLQKTLMMGLPGLFPKLLQKKAGSLLGAEKGGKFNKSMAGLIGKYFNIDPEKVLDPEIIPDSSGKQPDSTAGEGSNILSGLVKIEKEQLVGQEVKNPGVTRIVGGWAIMFLLFTLTGAATSLFEEKQEGSLKRLVCMPIKRSELLWSKYIYSILLGIFQLLILFLFSWILFDVDIFSNFFNLVIVIAASASAAVAFGMIITSFAKSLAQANGLATFIILIMSAVGGSWFPVSLLPDWMQMIAKFTLTYWSVEAFLQVLWAGAGFADIAFHILILVSMAVIINFYSLLRFRSGKVI